MLKFSHANLTFLSGAIWMAVGIFLLQMGIKLLLIPAIETDFYTPLIALFTSFFNPLEAALLIIAFSLYIGFLKGKHILAKTAHRGIQHIKTLSNPAPIHLVYGKKYFLLIGIMMLLGIALKYTGIPNDIRGVIDVAVGSALIQGAVHYFRAGIELQKAIA